MSVEAGTPLDLVGGGGRAVLWALVTEDMNVNLVAWPAGDGVAEHVNDAVDVLLVVVTGSMSVRIGSLAHTVGKGQAIAVPKGAARSITAGSDGVRYLTVHGRRGPLVID